AFLEVEMPGARLLRHQAALQAVGQLADDRLQVAELLIEMMAQPRELLGVAQIVGADDLVELLGECLVGRLAVMAGEIRLRRTAALAGLFSGARNLLLHAGFGFHLGCFAAGRISRVGLVHAGAGGLALLGILALGLALRLVALAVLGFALV